MAVKNAAGLLEDFCRAVIGVEVTHRSRRRLFGLAGLAPSRDVVRAPHRPDPDRGRGRPRREQDGDAADGVVLALPPAPLTPLDRRQLEYGDPAISNTGWHRWTKPSVTPGGCCAASPTLATQPSRQRAPLRARTFRPAARTRSIDQSR
jgi:hypothetical protein